jgi:hypothetical protein
VKIVFACLTVIYCCVIAAISLTFDDVRHSQVTQGLPILDEYGTKATFYVSILNLEGQSDAWKRAAINGHEIGEKGPQTTYSSTIRAHCEYAQNPADGLWLDTVQAVANHILKQRTDTKELSQ